jgi:hypothetical protein
MRSSVKAALLVIPLLAGDRPAAAGSLRGTLQLPPAPRATDVRPLAYWRIENGVLPIAQPAAEPRREVVLALLPERAPPRRPEGQLPPPVALEAKPLRLEPRVAIAEVGAPIVVKNTDRAPRTLYLKDGEGFMPREATAPGAERTVRFTVAGEYTIADVDNPRATVVVVVVATPFLARADERGAFAFDAPDGKYTLKAFFRGAWTDGQPVEIAGGRARDATVRLPRVAAPPSPDEAGGGAQGRK